MDKKILLNYANAIARVGGNVQKGQEVFITANVNDEEFTSLVVEECYKAGAKKVYVDWKSEKVSKLSFKYVETETLAHVSSWVIDEWKHKAEVLPVTIWLDSDDPDALDGVAPEKLMAVSRENAKVIKPIRKPMENKYQWCIAATPSVPWAKKLFPELKEEEAMEKLWEVIIKCARCDGDDPIENWNKHNKNLKDKCAWLNSLDIDYLEYKSSNGTNFKVGLHKECDFISGKSYTLSNNFYNPNMPSEECFTSPVKESAEGVIYASKPLSLNGRVIKNFGFRFEKGCVVEVLAENEDDRKMLDELVHMDEGACRLGEVALVPWNSPINESGILFYNTLFDENACCHLAVGVGFEDTIRGFEKLSKEEIEKVGINYSVIHTDFMVGTSDLSIVATLRDGSKKQIFVKGNWAE